VYHPLAEHVLDRNCVFDLSNVSFVDVGDNEIKLLKKETIAIQKSSNLVNRNDGVSTVP